MHKLFAIHHLTIAISEEDGSWARPRVPKVDPKKDSISTTIYPNFMGDLTIDHAKYSNRLTSRIAMNSKGTFFECMELQKSVLVTVFQIVSNTWIGGK